VGPFRWTSVALGVLAAATSVAAQAPPDDALYLEQLFSLADTRNPELNALRLGAEAATYREPEASTLPDPMLQFGAMNIGIPDFNTVGMTMAPSISLSQRFPWPGKLSRAGEVSGYATEIAFATADEASWAIRARTASLFYALYSLDHRTVVMRETLGFLEDFRQIAMVMYTAGTGRQADVLRAEVEVARVDGDIRKMVGQRRAQATRLNAIIDAPASAPVGEPILGALPTELPDQATLEAWARETRPLLQGSESSVLQAESRTALAARQIWPDVTLGLNYGQRDLGSGTERLASLIVGVNLPIHAGSRQNAMRDAEEATWRLAEARHQGRQADVDARIGELLADLETARILVELYRDEVIPEARVTVESALSSYRVGAVDFMTLVDAQMTVNRYEGELYALLASYGTAIAALESTVGRTMPQSGTNLSEAR
jgi:outer membrane protein, heavy metal efflux system